MYRAIIDLPAKLNQSSQPSVNAYFDDEVLKREQNIIFKRWPEYAGHSLLVPELSDYFVLPHHDNGMVLTRGEQGIKLMSNVCRHRQATILEGQGNSKRFSCPMHRWTYDNNGTLMVAPKFAERPCLNLEQFNLKTWRGLQFTGQFDAINELGELPSDVNSLLDFDKYYFGHMEVHECEYNWKTFIEFYLEDYHVASFHPGLGKFVSCDDLRWSFGENWSAQTVSFYKGLQQPGNSDIYKAWHQAVLSYYQNKLPTIGAMWLLIYPNTMIEWYPLVTVISTIYPLGPLRSRNILEYYHPNNLKTHVDGDAMACAAAGAYFETAVEDNQIGMRMQAGRLALMKRGSSEFGPYQPQLEAGMEKFHHFLHKQSNPIDSMKRK